MAGSEVTFKQDEFIVSKTDLTGKITYGNETFIQISGYSEKELLGSPHNILRHPDMPASVFKLLWDTIAKGQEIFAYVKNQTKFGDYYWVYAHVTASFDENGKVLGYHSVRRKPKREAIKILEPIYRQMLEKERTGGTKAGTDLLVEILKKGGHSYEEFVFSL